MNRAVSDILLNNMEVIFSLLYLFLSSYIYETEVKMGQYNSGFVHLCQIKVF